MWWVMMMMIYFKQEYVDKQVVLAGEDNVKERAKESKV
jgi:hypothetical protein